MSALVLPYPLSTNRYWRLWNGRAVPSKEATAYKAQVQARAIDAGIKLIKGSVILNIMLRPKRNKDGTPCKVLIDLDNALKVAIDALNGIAYADDKQVIEIHIVKGSAVNDGGLVVQILEGGNNDEA